MRQDVSTSAGVAMNLGRAVVSYVVGQQDIKPFLGAGYHRAWLLSNYDGSPAVFDGEDKKAYAYLCDHWDTHGKVPPRQIFEQSFPRQAYKIRDSEATADELLERIRVEVSREILGSAVATVAELHDKGDIDGAVETFKEAAVKLAAGSAGTSLREIDTDDLDDLPDPVPLIDGILDAGTVTMLSGPSGKGKSFIALDWALSIAAGADWFGHESTQGSVLYVAAEGAHGQKRRVKAWHQAHGKARLRLIIDPANLGDPAHVEQLCGRIRAGNHKLVVLDTFAKCTTGMEENSARDMGIAIAAAYKLRDAAGENGTTVIIVHHTGYNTGRARGSSAIAAGVDNVYDVAADDPHKHIDLTCSKRKDGEPPAAIGMRLEQVTIPDGTSCVVVEHEEYDDGPSLLSLLSPDEGRSCLELSKAMELTKAGTQKQLNAAVEKGLARREEVSGRSQPDQWFSCL